MLLHLMFIVIFVQDTHYWHIVYYIYPLGEARFHCSSIWGGLPTFVVRLVVKHVPWNICYKTWLSDLLRVILPGSYILYLDAGQTLYFLILIFQNIFKGICFYNWFILLALYLFDDKDNRPIKYWWSNSVLHVVYRLLHLFT